MLINSTEQLLQICFRLCRNLVFGYAEIWVQLFKTFVSLTLSSSPQFVNYLWTSKANTLLFFVEKSNSHIFSTNINSVFVIHVLPFEILTNQ